jgi:circadian clock protein KaiC
VSNQGIKRKVEKMASKLSRLPSGIPGLDSMMEGGFPFPSTNLVAGSAGTGKTTFALQFLSQGAKDGEQGLFFTTLSEPTQWMLRFVSGFEFIDKDTFGKEIQYVELGTFLRTERDPERILDFIEDHITEVMPQRIVIDPVTVLGELLEDNYRSFLYDLTTRLKNWQSTTILTGEVLPSQPYPVEVSYIVDGILVLSYEIAPEGGRRKYLEILKMRGTNHMTGKHLVDISVKGFTVQPGLR